MTQDELKMVLEALKWCHGGEPCGTAEAIAVVEKALAQSEQEPAVYDKTEMNCFVQDLYDKKMKEGKHGHYETMFHVVHQAIKRVPPQRTWVGLTDEEIDNINYTSAYMLAREVEGKLKERNQ